MITIRKGKTEDIPSISKLLIDSWRDSYSAFIPSEFLAKLDVQKQIQRHTKYMHGTASYFVAECEKKELIGFSSYGQSRFENTQCEKELYTIYVNKFHIGKGVGKLLLDSVLHEIKESKDSIAVSVFQKNPFRSFYRKNGFEKIDEEKIDFGNFELISDIYLRQNQ